MIYNRVKILSLWVDDPLKSIGHFILWAKAHFLQVIKSINKPNDCQIAFYAIHFKEQLVHNDKDFVKIARHTSLKVY